MPWKTSSIVLERERFALAALRGEQPFARLCAECGVSRKTGYKWLARFRAGGAAALRDQSRRPQRCARQKPARWPQSVRQVRRARPHWGARKIWWRLRELHPRCLLYTSPSPRD